MEINKDKILKLTYYDGGYYFYITEVFDFKQTEDNSGRTTNGYKGLLKADDRDNKDGVFNYSYHRGDDSSYSWRSFIVSKPTEEELEWYVACKTKEEFVNKPKIQLQTLSFPIF